MRLILIYGEKDAGKSTTCANLLKSLRELGCYVKSHKTFSLSDFSAVIEFRKNTIGIYSAGDAKDYLSGAIAFGKTNHCDILIATVRKGIAYKATLKDAGVDNSCQWISLEKGNSNIELTANENDAIAKILDILHNY